MEKHTLLPSNVGLSGYCCPSNLGKSSHGQRWRASSCSVTKTEDKCSWKMSCPQQLWHLSLLGAAQPGTSQSSDSALQESHRKPERTHEFSRKVQKNISLLYPKICFLIISVLSKHLSIRFLFVGDE